MQAPWYAYAIAFLSLTYLTIFAAEMVHLVTMGSHLPLVERMLDTIHRILTKRTG